MLKNDMNKPASILAIETATEACSVALLCDGNCQFKYIEAPRLHAEMVLPWIKSLLDEASLQLKDIDALAFGRGPGAFTGVRIATSIIQGLAFGAELPVIPISTLAALAWACFRERGEENVIAAFDARMDEVYWGAYRVENDSLVLVDTEIVARPENIPAVATSGKWFGAGTGWKYADIFLTKNPYVYKHEPQLFPHARYIAELAEQKFRAGDVVDAEHALPVYLRDSVAWKKLPGRE